MWNASIPKASTPASTAVPMTAVESALPRSSSVRLTGEARRRRQIPRRRSPSIAIAALMPKNSTPCIAMPAKEWATWL